MDSPSLARSFGEALASAGVVGGAPADVEEALAEHVRAIAGAWPGLEVDEQRAVAALARVVASRMRDEDEKDPRPALAEVRAPEIYLAAACAAGEPRALAAFEERYLPDIDVALRRVVRDAAGRDELVQQIRHKLFVASEGARPKILDYSGRGELGNWLRATAVRQALNFVTRGQKQEPLGDQLLATVPAADGDPELLYAKSLYKAELKAAFADAAEALAPRERNLLRYACVEGLSIDAIGAVYGTHRATAARWLSRARERLLAGVRRGLIARLKIPPREVDSVLRLVESGVSITVERYLAAADE